MIKTRKFRYLLSFVICLWLFAVSPYGYAYGQEFSDAAAENGQTARVYDQANLFTEQEIYQFEQEIAAFTEKTNMDVVIVTTDQTEEKSTAEYADEFYINGNFGIGKEYSGVLFLIDMDNRELYINAVGSMRRFLTDSRRETMLDHVFEGAENADFQASAASFLNDINTYYEKGIPGDQYHYDTETGQISVYRSITRSEGLIAITVAFMVAILPCLSVKAKYGMKKQYKQAGQNLMAYRNDCQFAYSDQQDHLLGQSVTTAIIRNHTQTTRTGSHSGTGSGSGSRPGSSSGRRGGGSSGRSSSHSSSGRSFSGSGRKF